MEAVLPDNQKDVCGYPILFIRYFSWRHPSGSQEKSRKAQPAPEVDLFLTGCIFAPVQMASGFLCWGNNFRAEWGLTKLSLGLIALVHTLGAFAIFSFFIVHIDMTTTEHTIFSHIKAMTMSWEKIEAGVEIEDWEQAGQHT